MAPRPKLLSILCGLLSIVSGLLQTNNFKLIDSFLSLEEVDQFIQSLDKPELNPEATSYNYQVEWADEQVPVVTIGTKDQSSKVSNVVVLCGLNPSHWGAIHSCLNLIRNPSALQLPTELTDLKTDIQLVVVPVANRAGYQYTINQDRLYSKNLEETESPVCKGIHLNSNWDYEWDKAGSSNPCATNYRGNAPNSAQEVKIIDEYLSRLERVKTVIVVEQGAGEEITYSDLLNNEVQSENRHEVFQSEKMANAAGRFGYNDAFKFSTGPMKTTPGSALMYFRHGQSAEYGFSISLDNEVLTPDTQIEQTSLALIGAVEVAWRNADKRDRFNLTALDDYVWRRDDTYAWDYIPDMYREDEYTQTYVLNVTSQTWLSDDVMDRSIWWHYAVLVVPKETRVPDAALALIVGWNNKASNDPSEVLNRSDTKRLQAYVASSGIVAVAVYQTPNQPITFVNEPLPDVYGGRTEDGIIARTWRMFVEDTTEPDVLLRLPMTKGVVRSVDAVEDFLVNQLSRPKPIRWGAAGASKRGWTTWTLGAADYERFIFITPVWLDNLKLIESTHHHYRSLGGYTYNFFDYYVEGFTMDLDRPEYAEMCQIVDPYTYLDRYARSQTILLQNAGNDEFFLPSDTWFYWDEMKGDKFLKIYPNKGHGGVGLREKITPTTPEIDNIVWKTINGVFEEVLAPKIFQKSELHSKPWTWTMGENSESSFIELESNIELTTVRGWISYSATPDRRDFRNAGLLEYVCGDDVNKDIDRSAVYLNTTYYPIDVDTEESGGLYKYTLTIDQPQSGYVTYFIDGEVENGRDTIYMTTQANIAPNNYQYPDCEGEQCLGCLI